MAFILWYAVFLTDILGSFWLRVTLASAALALYALVVGGADPRGGLRLNKVALARGAVSGVLLYALFDLCEAAVVGNVRHKLRVGLGLVEAAHDPTHFRHNDGHLGKRLDGRAAREREVARHHFS